jgi:hypothetical protein
MPAKKSNKVLIIGAVAVGGFLLWRYMSGSVGITAAGNPVRDQLAALVTDNPVFHDLVYGLTDAQASALQAWNQAGRPSSWQTDPVLGPVLTHFKTAGNFFF